MMSLYFLGQTGWCAIHHAPLTIRGDEIRSLIRYPLSTYRVFSTDPNGVARSIPFQIDEINEFGDYVLEKGKNLEFDRSNGVFDLQDELVIMGDDVGSSKPPTKWLHRKPDILKEIRFQFPEDNPVGDLEGSIYVGVYFRDVPPLSDRRYVVFDPKQGAVKTSRFLYKFDQENYLVVRGVDLLDHAKSDQLIPLIQTSTFFMRADLKYFLTLEVNQKDINSELEAYKSGPIRTIVRVTFFYSFLKINFELGMYTEVSIFSNSVVLPAVMYNPLDGAKSLNEGSEFYYGFAFHENPKEFSLKTNIPPYQKSRASFFESFFKKEKPAEPRYWLTMGNPHLMMFLEILPSDQMIKEKNIPYLYLEEASASEMYQNRRNDKASPLGKAPVNLGLSFDLSKFKKGEHKISFRLLFDNRYDEKELSFYPKLHLWKKSLHHH